MTLALQLLWVAAHHGLRQRSIARDSHDAAPYPMAAWNSTPWGHVHDITKDLGHPAVPSAWTVRR